MSEAHSTPAARRSKPATPYPDFPLFPHAAGVWAKKVRGKLHYFGPWNDLDGALKQYLEHKDDLHAGRTPRPDPEALTVKELANAFLHAKQALVDTGELSPLTWSDYKTACDEIVAAFGKTRLLVDIAPDDFASLRNKMTQKWGPQRLGKTIQFVRCVFKHAYEAGLIDRPVRFGPEVTVHPTGSNWGHGYEDRFLVYDTDFSQKRVVWQARTQPRLVVHGPPGTGKSQTIVNIIADALAHDRTVLMVCQKQAATRVVLERLRAVGLEELCLEVHDAAANRQEVFKSIRRQVEQLKESYPGRLQARTELSYQIDEKERLLDEYAPALHELHPRIGVSYCQMKAREGSLSRKSQSLRELPLLTKALERVSAQDVSRFLPRARRAGELFRRADSSHNLWCHRQPTVMASPGMRVDVSAAMGELRLLDSEHIKKVKKHGSGGFLPADLLGFATAAPEKTKRLRRLQESHSLFLVTRAWMRLLSSAGDDELQLKEHQCQTGIKLARPALTIVAQGDAPGRKFWDILTAAETTPVPAGVHPEHLKCHWTGCRPAEATEAVGVGPPPPLPRSLRISRPRLRDHGYSIRRRRTDA